MKGVQFHLPDSSTCQANYGGYIYIYIYIYNGNFGPCVSVANHKILSVGLKRVTRH